MTVQIFIFINIKENLAFSVMILEKILKALIKRVLIFARVELLVLQTTKKTHDTK